MNTRELAQALSDLDITEGFVIRNGFITVWEHETDIPESLADYVALDVNK
jgi:hypothetical protein